jgi:hypothetical protein
MKNLLFTLVFTALAFTAGAQSRTLLNLDKQGVAIQGHDPVAYFTENRAVKGRPGIYATYRGALYNFASQENKERFQKEPAKYEPAFGGYCAYGVSKGVIVKIDPEAFEIINGRLLLQYDKGARRDFDKDPQGNLRKADTNWPGLVAKKGK